jgi:hypothetical protein
MVSLEGNIPPFRITRGELFDIIVQIQRKLNSLSSPIDHIKITLGNFTEECKTIEELDTFLKDVFLPKVAKDSQVVISSKIIDLHFRFSGETGKYSIYNARDTSEARSFEDLILTFFKKHRVSRVANLFLGEMLILMMSFFACFSLLQPVIQSFYFGRFLAYRGLYIFSAICLIALIAYIIWSNFTPDTPSFSFYHSLIWIEQPKTNAKWALVSTILVGIVIGYLSSFL